MSKDDEREVLARVLADLADGEDWPSNYALGGNATGTRDDEYKSSMLEEADVILAAGFHHDERRDAVNADDDHEALSMAILRAIANGGRLKDIRDAVIAAGLLADAAHDAAVRDVPTDDLASWLVDNGYAESARGYGHVAGAELAEAILAEYRLVKR